MEVLLKLQELTENWESALQKEELTIISNF